MQSLPRCGKSGFIGPSPDRVRPPKQNVMPRRFRRMIAGSPGTVIIHRTCVDHLFGRRMVRLELWGFDGCTQVRDEGDLLAWLRSDRRGPDGAFVLSHGGRESLWLPVHGDAAFLWFLPDRDGR